MVVSVLVFTACFLARLHLTGVLVFEGTIASGGNAPMTRLFGSPKGYEASPNTRMKRSLSVPLVPVSDPCKGGMKRTHRPLNREAGSRPAAKRPPPAARAST